MSEDLPSYDPEMLALLEGARPLTAPPADVQARILTSLEQRIMALPAGGGGGDGGGAGGAGGAAAGGARALAMAHPILTLGAVFVIGGLTGALVREATLPPARVVYVDRASAAPSAAAPADARTALALPEATSAAVPVASLPSAANVRASTATIATAAPSESGESGEHLRAESALLDTARHAVAQGEGERALAAITRHEATFPAGLLREEREALAVKALVLTGRGAEANARGAHFRERYPTSVLLPAVDSALRTVPR